MTHPHAYLPARAPAPALALALALALVASLTAPSARAADAPVSFERDLVPILKRSCTGCHHPGKLKGELDLTTYSMIQKGGKHGPSFKPKDPKGSSLVEEITGPEPSMPKEGDPLTQEEVAMFERWIEEGAQDDTPADIDPFKLSAPPIYSSYPVITSLAFSPDGQQLAISGYHETLLLAADTDKVLGRLIGRSPKIESIAFSPDGRLVGVAGSAPAQFGEIQIWDASTHQLVRSIRVSHDSVYGLSFSPRADRVAVGAADKSVRLYSVEDGKELFKFDNHSDWVFCTTFTVDGKRLLTGSRDRAMKLIDAANAQFIDDINKLLDPVLCFARHPKQDLIACGGEQGSVRIYKISDNQKRTAANNDVNLIREFDRFPGSVHAIAYSPDGAAIAVGGSGAESRLYKTEDGKLIANLPGSSGATFALAFHPTTNQVVAAGFDAKLRIYDTATGALVRDFVPFPKPGSEPAAKAQASNLQTRP